jgi:hypothetical protein
MSVKPDRSDVKANMIVAPRHIVCTVDRSCRDRQIFRHRKTKADNLNSSGNVPYTSAAGVQAVGGRFGLIPSSRRSLAQSALSHLPVLQVCPYQKER